MDELIARLRRGPVYGDPRNVGERGELDEVETDALMNMAATALQDAYAKISDQRSELNSVSFALTDATRIMGAYAREAGEAKGKLEASELAGIVEGWKRRAEKAERELDLLRPAYFGDQSRDRREGGLSEDLVERWRKWCLADELVNSANAPTRKRSDDELDQVLLKAAELIRTGAHQ